MKKSFITVSPDSGQNYNVLNIACDKTTLSANRNEVLNVTGGGGYIKLWIFFNQVYYILLLI